MRVLFTTVGSPSHGRAQLPLARALAAAGHEVLVATTALLVPVFERDDVRVVPCIEAFEPRAFLPPGLADDMQQPGLDDAQRRALIMAALSQAISGPMAQRILESVRPVAREFRPHLILRDGMDMSACLLAEQLGIPQLPTPSGSSNCLDPVGILPGLNARREDLGLPTQDDPLSLIPHGRIDYVPPAFSFAQYLPSSWAYRQTVAVDRGSVLPRWAEELPTDRPLVYAAIGTALPMFQDRPEDGPAAQLPMQLPDPVETLSTIIKGVSALDDCTVVVSTSGVPVDTEALPAHVRLVDRLPQPLLLESVDLFLTHGGFNSIREAMRTATPMAVLPQFGDQHDNARRVQELGLGREITDSTADGITAACRAVLADPAATARARQARLTMLTLPEIEAAVPDLEKLAG